jgi:hypothetical protein
MLGQNIQQFDEALGTPITQVDGMRRYKWSSDNGTDSWLMAYFDSNGTIQAVCFYKEGPDFTPDEYTDMNQVMPEGDYTWQADKDANKVRLQLPPELDRRLVWTSGNHAITNVMLRAGGDDPKYFTRSHIYGRAYIWQLTNETNIEVFDQLNIPQLKVALTPKPDDDPRSPLSKSYRKWLTSLLTQVQADCMARLLALVCVKLLWRKLMKTNQFGLRL